MRKSLLAGAWCVAAATALTACGSTAEAKETGNFTGKKIEFIIPFDPGGGYDSYARQLAPKLGEKLGAEVVVINKPGAGGLLATNEVWNSKPDGTTIVMFNTPGHLGSALAGADGVKYKPEGFSYIGQISSEPDVVAARAEGDVKNFDDVMAATAHDPVRFAATGPGSNEYLDPLVLRDLLGANVDLITGFSGSDADLAVVAGNADANSKSLNSQLPAIKVGDKTPLLVIGSAPSEQLKGIPTLLDKVGPDQREIAQAHIRLIESGRTIAAPPGMDPRLLNELRTAFTEVATDEKYVEAAKAAGRPVSFASGEKVEETMGQIMNSPAKYVDMLKAAYRTR
jgi:tripartite-type tricarboxylate transporter receptor subunit TctC